MNINEVLDDFSLEESKVAKRKLEKKKRAAALPSGGKKEAFTEKSLKIGTKNIPIPVGTETFKVLYHDDADGLMSAKVIKENLLKIMKMKWKDASDKELLKKIHFTSVTDADERNPSVINKVDRDPNQMLIAVDFNRFEKFGPKFMAKLKANGGFDYATDHHTGEDKTHSVSKQSKVKDKDTEGGVDHDFKSDSSHLASRIGIGKIKPSVIVQATKWDSATFDEKLEKELGLRKGDPKYVPIRKLANFLSQFTRGTRHEGASALFIKDGSDNLKDMLEVSKTLGAAVNAQAMANRAAKSKEAAELKIKKIEAKEKQTPKDKRDLESSKSQLSGLDKKIADASAILKKHNLLGKKGWEISADGPIKDIVPWSVIEKKAVKDLDRGGKAEGFQGRYQKKSDGSYERDPKGNPKKKSHDFKFKSQMEGTSMDGLELIGEDVDFLLEAKPNKTKQAAVREIQANMKKGGANRKQKNELVKKALAKKGDRVVVSKLAGKGQPGRYTAFAFKNKFGQKPLFGIRQWSNMIQVSLSPDAPENAKKEVDLNKIVDETLKAAKEHFGKNIKDKKNWNKHWSDIIQPDGYGHNTISTIQNFFKLNYMTPFDKKWWELEQKVRAGKLDAKDPEYLEVVKNKKAKDDEYKSGPNGAPKIVDWVVKDLVKRLEKLSYGVVVESVSETKELLTNEILKNAGIK